MNININGFFTDAISVQKLVDMSSTTKKINALELQLDIDGLLLTVVDLDGSYKVRVDYSPLNRVGWERVKSSLEAVGLEEEA